MIHCLLIGPTQQGGEGVYVREVAENPPEGVKFALSQRFHEGAEGARCNATEEMVLNRIVYPFVSYTYGFRAFTLDDEVDIVHVHSHPTRLHMKKRRVPVVMSCGSCHYIYLRDYLKWSPARIRLRYGTARAFYRLFNVYDELLHTEHVARVYTLSNWAREFYVQHGVPRAKVDVLPPGFGVPPEPDRTAPRDTVNFLFVGREFVRKGGPLTVAAFKRLREKRKDVTLTIATRDHELAEPGEGITILPFTNRETLYNEIYPAADVYVMPTEAEGWGFTNAEAMSFALPIISTNINAIPEIILHDRTGILIDPGDCDALVRAMERLATSRDLRLEMGRLARERYIAHFSRDVFRANLRAFYDAALKS